MKQTHYVYVLQRRDRPGDFKYADLFFNFEPFYVGKGSRREFENKILYDRLLHTIHKGNDHKMSIIQKTDIEVSMFIFETSDEAYAKETEFIEKIGRKDLKLGPLSNWCNGGAMNVDGKSHFKRTAKYDRSGKLIKIYLSSDSAHKDTGISNISRACSKKILAGNFFWRNFKKYENVPETIDIGNYFENRIHDGNVPRSVQVIDEKENIIIFASIKEASNFTNVGSPTICRACKNNKTYNGYKFKYIS